MQLVQLVSVVQHFITTQLYSWVLYSTQLLWN
jgi:hypothetical protein